MPRQVRSVVKWVALPTLVVSLAVVTVGLLASSHNAHASIDERFVTIKSKSDIELTIDKDNNPDAFAYFEVFSPSSDVYPYAMLSLHEKGALSARGPITVDITQKSGGRGREALILKGSADNVDVGVVINKKRFFIWNRKDNTRADLIIRS